jgi:hypothetical protein
MFVDLNAKVGGFTYQDTYRVKRSPPDLVGVKRAYRTGAVDIASNLNKVAIIDLRGPDPGLFHDVYRTYAMQARLQRDFGTSANQVLWRGQAPIIGDITFADQAVYAVDHWLRMVHGDHRAIPLSQKIIQDRPGDVVNRCTDGAGTDLPAEVCDTTVQAYGTPRMTAGMPKSDDILDCHLKKLRTSDYPVKFTPSQWATLKRVFPHGVCNYNRPSIGFRKTIPWLTYQKPNGHVIYGGRRLRTRLRDPTPASTIVTPAVDQSRTSRPASSSTSSTLSSRRIRSSLDASVVSSDACSGSGSGSGSTIAVRGSSS